MLVRAKDLRHTDWMLHNYGSTTTVQCGSGWWATGYKPCAPNLHFDLSTWTLYERKGSKGSMPHPAAPPEHNVSCFKRLTEVFQALWTRLQQVPQRDPTAHKMLVLCCSSHIHEPQFWEAIISPIRNARLMKDGPCALIVLEDLTDYAAYLNAEFHLHTWPQETLLQL